MKRNGSLLIESLIALMILAIAIIFIGRGLGPLKKMTDDAVIQQDLLDLGASVADMILSNSLPGLVGEQLLNGEKYSFEVSSLAELELSEITNDTTLPGTITVDVVFATISTVGINPARTLCFSVFPYN